MLLAQTEARLQVAVEKLSVYEKMESDLDKAIEASVECIYTDDQDECEMRQVVELWTNPNYKSGTVLPSTLATRRLEHCLDLAKRLADSTKRCRDVVVEKNSLQNQLRVG